jgi:DNA repair protein RecO (recombination protein O)
MPSSQSVHTEALLVRSVVFGETHRMLTLITADLGKVTAMAPGARRSRRRFPPGTLQPFQLLKAVLTPQKKGELLLVSEAEILRHFPSIPTDPARYAYAAYVVELVRELTPSSEPDSAPLRMLEEALEAIENQPPGPRVLAGLVLKALELGGVAPCLDRCAGCGRPAPEGAAGRFDITRGVVCSGCGGQVPVIKGRARSGLIELATSGHTDACDDDEIASSVDLLMRFARHQLGRELKSQSLVKRYLSEADQSDESD